MVLSKVRLYVPPKTIKGVEVIAIEAFCRLCLVSSLKLLKLLHLAHMHRDKFVQPKDKAWLSKSHLLQVIP